MTTHGPVVEDEIAQIVKDQIGVLQVHRLGQNTNVHVADELVEPMIRVRSI